MKFFRIALPLLSLLWISPALAQLNVLTNFQTTTGPVQVSAANPLPITGSFSVGSFTATSTGTPISVTTGGVSGTLPAGVVVVATNVGTTNGAYCALGASATTSSQYIAPNGGWFAFTVGAATQLTCITSASTTTVNMTGGSGLPAGTGGGGGGSGGAITIAAGGVNAGAYVSGSVLSGAFASGSFASGSMVDLLTVIGTKAPGTAAASSLLAGGEYVSGGVTLTTGQQAALQLTSTGALTVSGSFYQATQPVSIASAQVASGAVASGAFASGSIASGAIASGAIASGALASGAGADGWNVTQGAKADSVCSTATGTCSEIALIKYLNTAVNSAVPVTLNGTATGLTGLTPGSAQTGTIVAANIDITSLHGTALSAASLPVTVASGGIASGGIASGAIASGAIASGSIAAGAVSAGAYVSGSVLSGAFASGSLASGSMVDLITFQGTKAAGTAAANSLLTGGVYNTSLPGPTNGQQTATQLDNLGRVITAPPSILSSKTVNGTTAAMTGTSSTSVVALVSSQRLYIMAVHCTNSSANATLVLLQDGSAGTTLDTLVCPAGGGDERNGGGFPLFYTTAGNALYAQDVTTSASVIVQASGFSSAN